MRAVVCDLDGVLYPFAQDFAKWVEQPNPTFDNWSFYKDWGMSTPEFLDHYAEGYAAEAILHDGEPLIPAALIRRQIGLWQREGVEFHLVTHREIIGQYESHVARTTEQWLFAYDLPYNQLTLSGDKGDHCESLRRRGYDIVAVVEDNPDNLVDMMDGAHAPGFLIDQPWNQLWSAPGVTRVATFDHLRPIQTIIERTGMQ